MSAHDATEAVAEPTKPLLRGWLHLVCFFLAIPAGVLVIALAGSPRARLGAAVYAAGLVALFGVSGAYHRGPWSPTWRRRMQCLDHTTIFVMIAGSYTPLALLVLDGWVAVATLATAWTGAALGGVLAWTNDHRSAAVRSGLYIALGWFSVAAAPQLVRHLSPVELGLIAVGGVLFTVGAIFLLTRWPDPFPRVFGYHEVWHTLVVAAVVCHLIAIGSVIHGASAGVA
jgi:hemolysin III